MIQAIVCSFVAMSGAGMSVCGPISRISSDVKRRVSFSSSRCESAWRSHADPALRAAVRQPQQRALPRHPGGERGALAERDLGVVADAALRRAEHGRVLDAVAGEDLDRAVVAAERDADDDRALGVAEPLGDHVGDARVRKRLLVLGPRHAEQRRVPLEDRLRLGRIQLGHAAECTVGRRTAARLGPPRASTHLRA